MQPDTVLITGGGHTRFGNHSQKDKQTGERKDTYSLEQMLGDVIGEALSEAALEADAIDAIYMGSCSPGAFTNQELLGPIALQQCPSLRFKPVHQSTAACASSSMALHAAADALQSGRINAALVVGIEKMTLRNTPQVTEILGRCSYWPEESARGVTFPGLFARIGEAYRQHHRIGPDRYREMLATVAASNYSRGIHNPLAQFGPGSLPESAGLTSAQSILELPEERNPVIAPPLHLHDCSPISDGAVALVLVRADSGLKHDRAAAIAGRAVSTDYLPLSSRPALYKLEGARDASARAYREAGISVNELDLVEVHDCFTSNQLLCLEALGLSDEGCAGEDYLAGLHGNDARCQVNLSGGLKSKGHPVGATGASMHYFAYRQLTGRAVGMAHADKPEFAAVLNIGGSGVVNCTTILQTV